MGFAIYRVDQKWLEVELSLSGLHLKYLWSELSSLPVRSKQYVQSCILYCCLYSGHTKNSSLTLHYTVVVDCIMRMRTGHQQMLHHLPSGTGTSLNFSIHGGLKPTLYGSLKEGGHVTY